MTTTTDDIVLRVSGLQVDFGTHDGVTRAVRDVSFDLPRGRTVALVGESGSGKSVTSNAILRLIQKPGRIAGGSILFHPRGEEPVDIAALPPRSDRLFRLRGGQISMIFQEPMTSLSPVHTIGNQVCEAILLHQKVTKREAHDLAVAMLGRVGISDPDRRMKQYPFEFSGGMRQRVVIAMALVCRPEILIADEPTTALDVTIQAQILELIRDLQREMNTSVIFITHDLGVVAQVAHHVVVMQRGRVMESAATADLFACPYHPYTRRLLASLPSLARRHEAVERLLSAPMDQPLPPGMTLRPGADYPPAEPVLHSFANGRRVLLWPQRQEALA
jgi:ABC-type dipeptide/oligopeptide/nickel transport system ATPase component